MTWRCWSATCTTRRFGRSGERSGADPDHRDRLVTACVGRVRARHVGFVPKGQAWLSRPGGAVAARRGCVVRPSTMPKFAPGVPLEACPPVGGTDRRGHLVDRPLSSPGTRSPKLIRPRLGNCPTCRSIGEFDLAPAEGAERSEDERGVGDDDGDQARRGGSGGAAAAEQGRDGHGVEPLGEAGVVVGRAGRGRTGRRTGRPAPRGSRSGGPGPRSGHGGRRPARRRSAGGRRAGRRPRGGGRRAPRRAGRSGARRAIENGPAPRRKSKWLRTP